MPRSASLHAPITLTRACARVRAAERIRTSRSRARACVRAGARQTHPALDARDHDPAPEFVQKTLPMTLHRTETVRMTESIQQRRERRREFLLQLYQRVDGSVTEFVPAYELGADLGIEEGEVRKIFEYLEEKKLVMVDDHRAGIVRLTAAGVDEVESRA